MIAVIADDFTGAAETGAIGLRYGLTVEIQTEVFPDCKEELLIIDTDSRSISSKKAALKVESTVKQLKNMNTEWIYKKVDSVLRGNITAELKAIMDVLGRKKTLLVPANPSLGRTIRSGCYFINDKPLHKTDFAHDPEYPATSSNVLEILNNSPLVRLFNYNNKQTIHDERILICDAASKKDLLKLGTAGNDDIVLAGAAEFFAAILEVKGYLVKPSQNKIGTIQPKTVLFICGSTSDSSRTAIKKASSQGVPVLETPSKLFQIQNTEHELLKKWADHTINSLKDYPKVIVTVSQTIDQNPLLSQRICDHLAALVENVLNHISIEELYIEGGRTASTIARRLQWKRFSPCQELCAGVVRMRVHEKPDQYLTIKPGSYAWPEDIWQSV